jgi:hypothetical protein
VVNGPARLKAAFKLGSAEIGRQVKGKYQT